MGRILVCFFLAIAGLEIRVQSEVFTSTTHLIQLRNTEVELAKQLKIYLKKEYERLDHVKKFFDVIKDEISQTRYKEEQYFSNPINAYLFIKHLTIEWYHIKRMIPPDLSKIMDEHWVFPSLEDHTEAVIALLRLQDTYQLKTSQLAGGKIISNFRSKQLTTDECYVIGRVAYENGDFYHTLMWMQEALDLLDRENNNVFISKIDILDILANATFQQGNIEHAVALTEEMLVIDSGNVRAKNNQVYYESLMKKRTLVKEQRKGDLDLSDPSNSIVNELNKKSFQVKNERTSDNLEAQEALEKLCRQQHAQLSPKRQATLFCRYRHNNNPYLILRPVKEEQVLDEPALFLFHDVISDTDIEKIKALVIHRLQRALVRNATTNTLISANYRITKSAWLGDEDSPEIARLSRLISAVTNLTMETAENLQIANYGIGGHYEPHCDFYHKWENPVSRIKTGNRIATWLTYMSNVEWGGATVFPVVDGYIVPEKGSAVFWYNLYASGEVDYRTLHAACPVLIGNKWVANKWIHEYGQEFRHRCSVDSRV